VLHPPADRPVTAAPANYDGLRFGVIKRLVELMRGTMAIDGGGHKPRLLTIVLPLEIDRPPFDGGLGLTDCLLLIASEDGQFVSELAEPLNAWHGDPRWIDGFGGTLGLSQDDGAACSVLIVDARSQVLAALSFAHRAAHAPVPPSFILAVAEPAQLGGFLELSEGEVDSALASPLDVQLLANALHALPLWRGASARPVLLPATADDAVAAPTPMRAAAPPTEIAAPPHVTPITTHPRFGGESAVLSPQALTALRALGDDDAFVGDVIDSFRGDAREIMQRIVRAAAMADAVAFTRGLQALRNAAANLGAVRLCDVILALRDVGMPELREQGSALVQRLADELARFEAALNEYLPARGRRQRS
jgi:hypothetical protein